MYIIIMGGGRLGLQLAKELIADKKDVTVIEKNEERCKYLSSQIDCLVLCGSATDSSTLENAEVSGSDAFVAATGNDDSNLLASLMAKRMGAKKIITRLNEPQHEPVFVSNNFINIIVPESIEAGYLEKLVLKPKVADLFIVDHGKAELIELHVNNPNVVGKTIGEMNLNEDYFICGIYNTNDSRIDIATSDMLLTENCKITVLAKKNSISNVLKLFTK